MLTNSQYDIDGTLDDDTIDGIKLMMPIIHHPVPPAYDSREMIVICHIFIPIMMMGVVVCNVNYKRDSRYGLDLTVVLVW